MNWRFTRAGEWVDFARGEAIAFFFPVERGRVETFTPRFAPLDSDPHLAAQFAEWNAARTAFHREMADHPPAEGSAKWQKFYYRGTDAAGCPGAGDHQTKVRVKVVVRVTSMIAPGRSDRLSNIGALDLCDTAIAHRHSADG